MFVTNFSSEFKDEFIKVHTGDKLKLAMGVYTKLGFPGAFGSMDATHLWWNKCPVNLVNLCTGKEGYPTLTFNAIVDHHRYIQYVSHAFYGSIPDVAIAQMDPFPRSLMAGVMATVCFFIFVAVLMKRKGII